ncbi:MAG TPA: hypothetical protein VN641_04630 [Urbifossiella sp.]|nr:hypothetical protein [Urbifossiella sp.]
MHVHGPAAFIPLRDAGSFDVAVKDAAQASWNRKQPVRGAEVLIADPLAEFRSQVGAKWDRRAGAVLFVLRFQTDAFRPRRQIEPGNGQGSQFREPQAGVDVRAVDENALAADAEQPFDHLRAQISGEFPFVLPPANGAGLVEGSADGHNQKPGDFLRSECSTLPLRVGSFVGLRQLVQVVPGEPASIAKPVRKPDNSIPVVVPCAGAHTSRHRIGEPLFNFIAAHTSYRVDAEFSSQPMDGAQSIRLIDVAHARGGKGRFVIVDVWTDGASRGASSFQVGGVEYSGANLFGFAFPAGEFLPGVRFVAASGRALDQFAGVVLEAGVVSADFDRHGSQAADIYGNRRRPPFSTAIPAGERLAVLLDDGGEFRNRAANSFPEERTHDWTLGEKTSHPAGASHDAGPGGSQELEEVYPTPNLRAMSAGPIHADSGPVLNMRTQAAMSRVMRSPLLRSRRVFCASSMHLSRCISASILHRNYTVSWSDVPEPRTQFSQAGRGGQSAAIRRDAARQASGTRSKDQPGIASPAGEPYTGRAPSARTSTASTTPRRRQPRVEGSGRGTSRRTGGSRVSSRRRATTSASPSVEVVVSRNVCPSQPGTRPR